MIETRDTVAHWQSLDLIPGLPCHGGLGRILKSFNDFYCQIQVFALPSQRSHKTVPRL